jgi:hypothetical protein
MLDTELGRAILYLMQSQGLLSVNCTSYQLKKIMSTFLLQINILITKKKEI